MGFQVGDELVVISHLVGVRAFRVDLDGWLTGVTMRSYRYRAGRNDAVCLNRNRAIERDPLGILVNSNLGQSDFPHIEPQIPGPDSRDHDMHHCGCGIYGFYSEQHESARGWQRYAGVIGVVHAGGRTISGELGFRAAVADLVAICLPPEGDTPAGWPQVRENYPGVELWTTVDAMLEAHPLSSKPVIERTDEP